MRRSPIEIARNHEERESGGGPDAGRLPPGRDGVHPARNHCEEQRHRLRHETDSQQEQKKRSEHGHVSAGNHEGVEGAGGAVVFGPHLLKLVGLADENGLHHSGIVLVPPVKACQAGKRGGAQVHEPTRYRGAASSGQHANRAGRAGCRPIDVLPRQIALIVKCAGVLIVAGPAHARVHLDLLPVAQRGKRIHLARVERHLRTRMRLEFEHEARSVA